MADLDWIAYFNNKVEDVLIALKNATDHNDEIINTVYAAYTQAINIESLKKRPIHRMKPYIEKHYNDILKKNEETFLKDDFIGMLVNQLAVEMQNNPTLARLLGGHDFIGKLHAYNFKTLWTTLDETTKESIWATMKLAAGASRKITLA